MKILPVGAEFFNADRRTDMTKLMVAFRSFANPPKDMGSNAFTHNSFRGVQCSRSSLNNLKT
jgi:hypothetical protein